MDDSFYEKEVRNVIEKNTQKISLKDLEKKGFKNVKVLRQNDINLLIKQALDKVLGSKIAENAEISEQEKERYFIETKKEVERLMREQVEVRKKYAQIEVENKKLSEQVKLQEQKLKGSQGLASQLRKVAPSAADPQRVKELEGEIVKLRQQINQLEAQGGGGGGASPVNTQEAEALKKQNQNLQKNLQKAEGELKELAEKKEKWKNLEIQNNMLQMELRKLKDQLGTFDGVDLESLGKQEEEHKKIAEKLQALEKQNKLLEDQTKMYQEKAKVFEDLNPEEVKTLKTNKEKLQQEKDKLQEEKNKLQEKLDKIEREEVVALKIEVGTLQGKLEESTKIKAKLESLEKEELPQKNQEIMTLKAELMMERKKAEDLSQKLEEAKTQAAQAPATGGGGDGGMDSSQIVNTLLQQLQKAGLTSSKAHAVLDEANLGSLLSYDDKVQMETNIQNLDVKKQKVSGIKAHLARLKSLKGGDTDDKQG